MDPYVLPAPWPVRRMIVSAFILPTRPKHTAAAYRSIWRDEKPGSPLVHYSLELAKALREKSGMAVTVGMRYGSPSLDDAIEQLAGVDEIFLVPLYPQHAESTRTTTIHRTRSLSSVPVCVMPPFYDRNDFLDAMAARIRNVREPDDYLLFSYHGLPERHLTKADPTHEHCLASAGCCRASSRAHATCYRHQCFATTDALVARLGVEDFSISFQSRRGRQSWLEPYTDEVLADLPRRGIKELTVVCPAFTADNLETLEEIGMQGRELFKRAGGKGFRLVPCLNDESDWVAALANWCKNPPPEAAFDREVHAEVDVS